MLVPIVIYLLFSCAQGWSIKSDYSVDYGRTNLYYAYAAYCDTPQIQQWNCTWCGGDKLKAVSVVENTQLQTKAFIGYLPATNTAVLSFRGSNNLMNWLHNIEFTRTQVNMTGAPDGVLVHSGFHTDYYSIRDQVHQAINELLNKTGFTELWITGHSLGGAMSHLAAVDFHTTYTDSVLRDPRVITFGTPRVGNLNFVSWVMSLNLRVIRVTNNHDLVPRMPPQMLGYHHIPSEVWYSPGTEYNFCDGSGEDIKCEDSVYEVKLSVPDHLSYLGYHESCHDDLARPPTELLDGIYREGRKQAMKEAGLI